MKISPKIGMQKYRKEIICVCRRRGLSPFCISASWSGANGPSLDWKGTPERKVTLGNLTVCGTFGVVRGLWVKCILGTPFTEKHVTKIREMDYYIRPRKSRVFPFLSDEAINWNPAYANNAVLNVLSDSLETLEEIPVPFRVIKQVHVTPLSASSVR